MARNPLVAIVVALAFVIPVAPGLAARPAVGDPDPVDAGATPEDDGVAVPLNAPNGVGVNDPWVDANGDLMFGDLNMQDKAVVFNGKQLKAAPSGLLQWDDRIVCMATGNCGTNTAIGPGWSLAGNVGITPGQFLGTLDIAPLEFRVANERALRIEVVGGSPNLIGGHAANAVGPGAVGAAIAGGGWPSEGNQALGDWAFIGSGTSNVADTYGVVGGGSGNRAMQGRATVAGGSDNAADASFAFVGGGEGNSVTAAYGTIAGGGTYASQGEGAVPNRVTDEYGTIGGGRANLAGDDTGLADSASYATTAGGFLNRATDTGATIGGGVANVAGAPGATVAGGSGNAASADGATIGGGSGNAASGLDSTVAGGTNNAAAGTRAAVGGGYQNVAGEAATHRYATVAGGFNNMARADTATVGGGQQNTAAATSTTVAGGEYNAARAWGAFVGGGEGNLAQGVTSAIAGGDGNVADNLGTTVGGGRQNRASGSQATVGGGDTNQATGALSTVGGGSRNQATSTSTTVGGGFDNRARGWDSVVSGGSYNKALGQFASVGGGSQNVASTTSGRVGGGFANNASGTDATIGGGSFNTASGLYSTVPGGRSNVASGRGTFAAGHNAKATHDGTFVWADFVDLPFPSVNPNGFSARATGGFRLVSGVDNAGTPTAGVRVLPGASAWTTLSDRDSKRDIEPVDGRDVLQRLMGIPLSTWSWKAETGGVRHMGPMAQDFRAAFDLGAEDTTITTVDADGVALAAIQGLAQVVEEQESEIQKLQAELAELRALVETMAAR